MDSFEASGEFQSPGYCTGAITGPLAEPFSFPIDTFILPKLR